MQNYKKENKVNYISRRNTRFMLKNIKQEHEAFPSQKGKRTVTSA